ncbi:MAG: DinB family protein [Anaerolineae bacterium]
MGSEQIMHEQLLALLNGGHAHMEFDQAVAEFPLDAINRKPPHVPYTPWHLLEHLRLAQWDILEFIRNPNHVSPDWPTGYWPSPEAQADAAHWQQTISAFQADLKSLEELVANPETDLFAPLPQGLPYTIFREIMVVANHNSYHIGEFAILRQVMDTWE